MRGWMMWAAICCGTAAGAADLPYVNYENHPIRALDLSPDRRVLAVAHTADQRVQFFDVSGERPQPLGHVLVGVDPVAVRFRSNGELWVANHVSDSVSVVDVATRRVRATLSTADEPFDIAFANGRAFVSCSQVNRIEVYDPSDLSRPPQSIAIAAEDPRALAVSADGRFVYAAIFESGNATTILGGGLLTINAGLPNVVSDARGPYGGRNPPPNAGQAFDPPMNAAATPPPVGLIVRRDAAGRWRDDNNGDWTQFVSGPLASASARRPGWNLPDRDIAVIDTSTLSVRYISGLMNIGMALSVRPGGELTLVGTEALNEIRFEPKLNGRFAKVQLARVDPAPDGSKRIVDLNPHLNYAGPRVAAAERRRSLGDPRAIVWRADGQRGWVAGLGSNNIIAINAEGARVGEPIAVGEGPIGLALDEGRARLYAWNHFEASLSQIDIGSGAELSRTPVFNPLPTAIKLGRPFLYDTQRTSGTGHVSCATCHVDARMDRLAWDLGDPSQPPQRFDQNCITQLGSPRCEDWHAMKGPMTTQTMQDIIGHEPHHWRGDRNGIEAFNPAFEGLLGDDALLTAQEMQRFEDFLATIHFPPNPFRNPDNSLPINLPLPGHFSAGRFSMAGVALPNGNALRGLDLYTRGVLDNVLNCSSCHSLPTGMAPNGPMFAAVLNISVGGRTMMPGPNGENHLGIVSTDGSANVSMKVPQLRNQHEKVGFELTQLENAAGFGFFHNGAIDSLARFFSANVFRVQSDQDLADLIALSLAFSGSDFNVPAPPGAPVPLSKDAHAGVGRQLSHRGGNLPAGLNELVSLARGPRLDLVVEGGPGYVYLPTSDRFQGSDGGAPLTLNELSARASAAAPLTFTLVAKGLGQRLGIDRDGDGVGNARELQQGSNPADATSSTLRASAGLWYNPARSGTGLDLQYAGEAMFATWYTYEDDGTPVWYQAAAARATPWVGELRRFSRAANGTISAAVVGELRLNFSDARNGTLSWRLGTRSGSEPIQPLLNRNAPANPDRTGMWYDPTDSGWGLSIDSNAESNTVVLFYYDSNGRARWAGGAGSNLSQETLSVVSFRGFCPDCPAQPTQSLAAGSLILRFNGARAGNIEVQVQDPAQTTFTWRRGPSALQPLSEAALRAEWY